MNEVTNNSPEITKPDIPLKPKADPKINKQTNVKIALSWFGAHVVALILCLIFNFSFISLAKSSGVYVVIGLIATLMYFGLMGGSAWKLGNDDLNKVKFNRRKKDMLRGFKLGCLATVPMFLLSIGLLLAKAEILPNFYIIYKVLNGHMLAFINLIDGTYAGVLSAYLTEVSWGQIIAVCSLNFVTPVVCAINYILGYKDVMMMDKIMYKKVKKAK